MEALRNFTGLDWLLFAQIMIIWFYMAYKTGQWFVGFLLRKGWRWWNRKDPKALAMDALYSAYEMDNIKPGESITMTTQSGLSIIISRRGGE